VPAYNDKVRCVIICFQPRLPNASPAALPAGCIEHCGDDRSAPCSANGGADIAAASAGPGEGCGALGSSRHRWRGGRRCRSGAQCRRARAAATLETRGGGLR
jgi:hypothetical protein